MEFGEIAVEEGEVGFLRNLRNAERNAVDFVGEKYGHFGNDGFEALLTGAGELIVLPPGLSDVVIGEDFAVADDKAGAEEIGANFGSSAFRCVDGIAFAIFKR